MKNQIQNLKSKFGRFFDKGFLLYAAVTALVILLGACAGLLVFAHSYRDRVFPGVTIGDIGVAGMNRAELASFLGSMGDKMFRQGIPVSYAKDGETRSFTLYPIVQGEGESRTLLDVDEDAEAGRITAYGKTGNVFGDALSMIRVRFSRPSLILETVVPGRNELREALSNRVGGDEVPPRNAGVSVASIQPLDYAVVPAVPGVVYQYDRAIDELTEAWRRLRMPEITIHGGEISPDITAADVQSILPRLPYVFEAGPLTLKYTDPESGAVSSWTITLEQIRQWLAVSRVPGDGIGFALSEEPSTAFLKETVEPDVRREALNAKFRFDETNGRVVEFQGSRSGVSMDIPETFAALNRAILDRSFHNENLTKVVTVAAKESEPRITTGEANTLGISDILGVGISNFSGSPKNRIANIKNAAKKLNGILVQPDAEFSTLEHLRPFTAEGGYLPELVIKGDAIKPEIGGGLCQIGTTLFRMAMKSALPITARRNHSLVVFYYNDPRNGLPGTDATIYDPAPDFRFKNDTGHPILIQTEADMKKMELRFTLWGKGDGRKGTYTAPVVSKWYAPGETRIVETDTIPVGQKECQHSYRGADASFVYTRVLSDGTKEDTTYASHYRALPEICLVGVEKKPEEAPTADPTLAPSADAGAAPIVVE